VVGVRGHDAPRQRHNGALEVEMSLAVEILDQTQRAGEHGCPTAELVPGGEVVHVEEVGHDVPAPKAMWLYSGVHPV